MGRPLTQKQGDFCLNYIESGNASEAYRRAYNAERMKPETINRKAKDLMDNGKIAARIKELRAPSIERAQITLSGHLEDLKRLRDTAEKEGRYSAAISAEIARGKAAGLYVDRHEHTGAEGSPIGVIIVPAKQGGNDDGA